MFVLTFDVNTDFGRRPRQQSRDADAIAGDFAVSVFAFADAAQRIVNLAQQKGFALAQPQVQPVLFFSGRTVGRVGKAFLLIQTIFDLGLTAQNLAALLQETCFEEFLLHIVHIRRLRHPADLTIGQRRADELRGPGLENRLDGAFDRWRCFDLFDDFQALAHNRSGGFFCLAYPFSDCLGSF